LVGQPAQPVFGSIKTVTVISYLCRDSKSRYFAVDLYFTVASLAS